MSLSKDLAQKLYDYAECIGKKLQDMESQRLLLKDVEKSLDERRDLVAGQVANDADDAGKLRYSNEALRKAEAVRRLAEDEEYQGLLKSREVIRENLLKAEAEYEELKWHQQAVRYHIRLLAAELITKSGIEVDKELVANLKDLKPDEDKILVNEKETKAGEEAQDETKEVAEFAPDKEILTGISQVFRQGGLPEEKFGEMAVQLTKQCKRQVKEEDIAAHLKWLAQRQKAVKRGNIWEPAAKKKTA